jgi:predicted HicB family RNase H-like nuclease
MKYNGYTAEVKYDEDAEVFFGTVINTKDTITFQSENAHELKKEFHDSVDDYLEFCAEIGEKPEKPFSGKFVLRVTPELHSKLFMEAMQEHKSLNEFIVDRLERQLV